MKSFLQLNRLVVFFISVGLFVLSFEIYLQHFDLLPQKKIMWTPIVFGLLGGTAGLLIAFVFNKISYYLFFVLMIVSICVGMLGLCLHNRWRLPALCDFLFYGRLFDFNILTTYTPLLAPSAFIAIGGLGILVALFQAWGERDKK